VFGHLNKAHQGTPGESVSRPTSAPYQNERQWAICIMQLNEPIALLKKTSNESKAD
jgi:hypothetical protein